MLNVWLSGPVILMIGAISSMGSDFPDFSRVNPVQNPSAWCSNLIEGGFQDRQPWEASSLQNNPRTTENCSNQLGQSIIRDETQIDEILQKQERKLRLDQEAALKLEQEQSEEEARRRAQERASREEFYQGAIYQNQISTSSPPASQPRSTQNLIIETNFKQHNENVRQHFERVRLLMKAIGGQPR
jgi:HD-GYP domain-containing protein (c-di-GMP phosphodiesterase class II)